MIARHARTCVRTHLAEHMCVQQCDDVSRMYVRGNLFYADVVHVCVYAARHACMHAHSSTHVDARDAGFRKIAITSAPVEKLRSITLK